jgi:hypothetical protein
MSQPKPIQTNIQDKNGKTHLCFSWWNLPSWTDVNSLVPTFGASQLDHNLTQLHNGSSWRPTRDCKLNLKDNSQFQEVKHCQSKSHKCFTCRVIYSHKLNRFNRAVECLKDSHLSGTQLSTSNCMIVRLEVQEPTNYIQEQPEMLNLNSCQELNTRYFLYDLIQDISCQSFKFPSKRKEEIQRKSLS